MAFITLTECRFGQDMATLTNSLPKSLYTVVYCEFDAHPHLRPGVVVNVL
jgi:hypothetical protein